MRKIITIISLILFSVLSFGQSVNYSYDGAGNRKGRSSGYDPGIIAPPIIRPGDPVLLSGAEESDQTHGGLGIGTGSITGGDGQLTGVGV